MINHSNIETIKKGIPSNDYEAWLKYPKLAWIYETKRLFEFQRLEWYPFPIDDLTTTSLPSTSIGSNILSPGKDVYIIPKLFFPRERTKFDLVIHKGKVVDSVSYTENSEGVVVKNNQQNGLCFLVASSLISFHFGKFCGIVSFEHEENIIIAARLTPHIKGKYLYNDITLRNLNNLYMRKRWVITKPSSKEVFTQ